MNQVSNIPLVFRTVFGNWRYALLGIFIAAAFYILNAVVTNARTISSFLGELTFGKILLFTATLTVGFWQTISLPSLISIIMLSILTGILASMVMFKINAAKPMQKGAGLLAGIGFTLGLLIPGCAACCVGLAAVLGLGASLATLPFKGIEISVLAILVVCVAIAKTSQDFFVCKDFNTVRARKKHE